MWNDKGRIFFSRSLIISSFWCLFAPWGFWANPQGSGLRARIFSNLTWFPVKQKDYRGILRIKTWNLARAWKRKIDRQRRQWWNDYFALRETINSSLLSWTLLSSNVFVRRSLNPQSFSDAHDNFVSSTSFFSSHNTEDYTGRDQKDDPCKASHLQKQGYLYL